MLPLFTGKAGAADMFLFSQIQNIGILALGVLWIVSP
jgi:hypothetical protein